MIDTRPTNKSFDYDITIVGGFGHVGLPLGILLATNGLKVCLYDIDKDKGRTISQGKMPCIEHGAEALLQQALAENKLTVSLNPDSISKAEHVVVSIGTEINEHYEPQPHVFLDTIKSLSGYIGKGQIVIIRSTVYPTVCRDIEDLLADGCMLAYCPERILQGSAIEELNELPQIVAGASPEATEKAARLFGRIAPEIIEASIEEAELIKLFANAWRYIQFAATNQFYMIAERNGLDYNRILKKLKSGYQRCASLPSAGFAAGPCLTKDTMNLVAYSGQDFTLGHEAVVTNEGLPNFIVRQLARHFDLSSKTIGILGMAFKAGVEDTRGSLSVKLHEKLKARQANVYLSDELIEDAGYYRKEELLAKCDVLIIGVPHPSYQALKIPGHIHLIDPWGIVPDSEPVSEPVPEPEPVSKPVPESVQEHNYTVNAGNRGEPAPITL